MPAAGIGGLLPDSGSGAGKIFHVVIIYQENRSFDNLFQGYPDADTVSSGKNSFGETIHLQPVSLATQYVIDHSMHAMIRACRRNGKACREPAAGWMDSISIRTGAAPKILSTSTCRIRDSKPYFDMAHEWVLADHMHQSHLDESFVSHQYIIAAQAQSSVDLPYGDWGCEGGDQDVVQTVPNSARTGKTQPTCFDYTTLGDELDQPRRSWRFYTSTVLSRRRRVVGLSGRPAHSLRPGLEEGLITPQKRFISDVGKGTLANVTWITPICANSDHVNCGGGFGPSWVTSLVNAVGREPLLE